MALILHIDTALQQANIGIARNGELIANIQSEDPYNHASFVQPAINQVLQQSGISIKDVDAVGVTGGPGSYTGLRVAMASAKGLCYALDKPLLSVGTLHVMATAAIENFPGFDFYCPMIDARRNEVFTAMYDQALEIITAPKPMILHHSSFEQELLSGKTLFCGNGAAKCKHIINANVNAAFELAAYNGLHIAQCLFNRFTHNAFEDLAYAAPQYLKEFYSGKLS